jgi:Mn-dependent DtxR family transcriptional regulator
MSNTTESLEMYLENILVLETTTERVRSIDVAHRTGYSKPSVCRAVKLLVAESCIDVDADGYITLTEKGREIATKILERHKVISEFFVSLGVPEETAADDACRIEHVISDESFECLRRHINNSKK